MDIHLPYDYTPRWYQKPSWNALWGTGSQFEKPGDLKRAFLLWGRRHGKDLNLLNLMMCKAAQRVGVYAHIFPTLTEGKKVIWRGMDREGRRFLDYIPSHKEFTQGIRGGWVKNKRDDDMTIELANGSIYQVLGADHPDSVRGMSITGCILSEYAFFKGPQIWDIIRPMLAENSGWMAAITTPNGRNHAHALHKMAEKNPLWFAETLPASYTHAVSDEAIQADRDSGMSEEKIAAEYECSYEAAVEGAFYGAQITAMRQDGRIGDVPFDPRAPVDTMVDIGVDDPTAVWWSQSIHGRLYLIDFEWMTGVGVDHVVKVMQEKQQERGFVYRKHFGPHDLHVREWGADHAEMRVGAARKLGLKFTVVPKRPIEDGRSAVRARLATTWIDEDRCMLGIDGLSQYQKAPMEGIVGPQGETLYTTEHVHNWASHPADALRTGVMGMALFREERDKNKPTAPKLATC